MATTEHYDFWYLDPDEEISDFPNTWDFNIDNIDAAIHDAATDPVSLSRLPNLPASKTTSGTFDDARIPSSIARSSTVAGDISDGDAATLSAAKTYTDDAAPTFSVDNTAGEKLSLDGHVISYKSGQRIISSDIPGSVFLSRVNDTVTVIGASLRPTQSGTNVVCVLPLGFRQRNTETAVTFEGRDARQVIALGYNPWELQVRYISAADGWLNFSLSFETDDPFPSALPGTPK